MFEPPLFLQREPPVATVMFNRPEARNALNEAMQRALPPMLEQLREDADIRVLIIRGAGGKAFAAGDDISQFVDWGAEEALQIGLINRLLPPDQAERYTYDTACKMATYAPLSLMQSKASVQLCLDNPELRGIAEPAAIAASLYDTEDFHAGVQAFLSKQPLPPFRGR